MSDSTAPWRQERTAGFSVLPGLATRKEAARILELLTHKMFTPTFDKDPVRRFSILII